MGELAAIAETLAKYGAWAIVAVLIVTVRALYNRVNFLQDARLADMKEVVLRSIETDKDQAHAMDKLTEALRAKS